MDPPTMSCFTSNFREIPLGGEVRKAKKRGKREPGEKKQPKKVFVLWFWFFFLVCCFFCCFFVLGVCVVGLFLFLCCCLKVRLNGFYFCSV